MNGGLQLLPPCRRRQWLRSCRQREAEDRAVWTGALERQRAAMCLGDPSRDRQAQAGPLSSPRWIELDEPVEDALPILGGNRRTAIADADGDRTGVALQIDADCTAGGRVLNGV